MSHKDDTSEFNYLNVLPDSSRYTFFLPDSTFHTFSESDNVYPHYSYQHPYQSVKAEQQYPVACGLATYQNSGVGEPKGFPQHFSEGELLTDDPVSTCLRQLNTDYCDFGTYDPFQGSPLEITNLSLHENLPPPPLIETYFGSEASASNFEVQENQPETVLNKRSYKDALTFAWGESSNTETVTKTNKVNKLKRETSKEKANSCRTDTVQITPKSVTKVGLNNYRCQLNANPKKPLKNNNLSENVSGKTSCKTTVKNMHSCNSSVQHVRFPAEGNLSHGKRSRALVTECPQTESLPSEDDIPTQPEARNKEKNKDRVKLKAKEKDAERSGRRQHRKNPPPNVHVAMTKAYISKVALACRWFFMWLYDLCSDVINMSWSLAWQSLLLYSAVLLERGRAAGNWMQIQNAKCLRHVYDNWVPPLREFLSIFRRDSTHNDNGGSSGLNANITLPSTGEEAMHRLLACKGRDPYSILGVRRDCPDEEIRRYYKRQAVLVHPDKNRQRGAEEAFKILAHAFELVGQPERRSRYDQLVQEADEMESTWAELNQLLSRLHTKMDEAANTIRCTNCAKRHRRIKTDRPCYAARYCQECKIHHSAREGDLWAESRYMGLISNYLACMEGAVYDITEWANCQAGHLRHLQSNSHRVQYRIVPGQGGQPTHGPGRKSS